MGRAGMGSRRRAILAAVGTGLVGAAVLAGCGGRGDPERADGSGSTFAQPAFDAWCAESDLCTYRGVGSGAGVEEVVDQATEFGASDVPMSPQERAAFSEKAGDVAPAGSRPIEVPVLVGAIAVPTAIAGIDYGSQRPRFSSTTLAAIFGGTIARWSDPSIAADNPGLRFPDAPITRCVREDSSGTSGVFTAYLSAVDPRFAEAVGATRLPEWPGAGVVRNDGNAGVAACVADRDDAIGYLDLSDAVTSFGDGKPPDQIGQLSQIGVPRDGRIAWTTPSVASVALAASIPFPEDRPLTEYGASLLGSQVPGAYPITATTYAILHDVYADTQTCDEVAQAMEFVLSEAGQGALERSFSSPVGARIRTRGLDEVRRVRDAEGRLCASGAAPD